MKEISHWIIGMFLNLLVISLLIRAAWNGNDKSIILVMFYYPALVIVNLLVGVILKAFGIQEASIYKTMALCLLIIFLPVLFIASAY